MIDVLVAGGGPAGLATAIRCAQAGLAVTVAEPRAVPIDKACGEGLMPSAVTRLAALGVRPAGRPLRGIRYLDASHRVEARFRHGDGLGVRRTTLHTALAARAAELSIPVLPVRVTSVTQDGGGVTAAGLRARYLVAADGLHSTIRRACGLDPPRARHPRFGLRRHYRLAPWTDLVEVHWAGGAEAYVTPVGPHEVGVAILTDTRGPDHAAWLGAFPALGARLRGAEPTTRVLGAGPLEQNVSRRAVGRVLLVGDAAGYVDALTGEGVSLGVATAAAAVDCVAADRPDHYERLWRDATRRYRLLTRAVLFAAQHDPLRSAVVPAAGLLPPLYGAAVRVLA